jgi:hypothetical protein
MAMTGQTRYRYDREWSPVKTLVAVLTSATRYDLALWAIPTAFAVALAMSSVVGISQHAALVGAALLGVLVLVDVIALNPPVEPSADG